MFNRNVRYAIVLGLVACSPTGSNLLSFGPRPAKLIGTWIDSSKTTPADSSIWLLAADGADRSMRVLIGTMSDGSPHASRSETNFGYWYVSGTLGDTLRQALCFKRRARNGGTCVAFRLDTVVVNGRAQRRLLLSDYKGQHHTTNRVLLERAP